MKVKNITEKLDDLLTWLTDSPMSNKDYNTIHKIFDKYLEIEEQQARKSATQEMIDDNTIGIGELDK